MYKKTRTKPFAAFIFIICQCISTTRCDTCANSTRSSSSDVTIGFLSSFHYDGGLAKLIAGAVPLAVEHVNADKNLLPNHTLKFVVGDTVEPDTATAIRNMTQMKDNGVVAFFGPDHCCYSEALVAAAWRLPMIAFKCNDRKVSDKRIFSTFSRTLPPSSKVSKSLIALLLWFKWNRIVLVVGKRTSDIQVGEALVNLAKDNKIAINKTFDLPELYTKKHKETLTRFIDDSYKFTRVYVLVVHNYAVLDFVRYMNEKRLLDKGEYVIISVEEQVYDPYRTTQFTRKETEAYLNNDEISDMMGSVLKVLPTYPIRENWTNFEDKVLDYSKLPPFSIPFHPDIRVKVPIHAGLLYDAIMIYSRAATNVLKENLPLTDGEAIFRHICNTSYESILGFQMRIDEKGDAEGNFTLLAYIPPSLNSTSDNITRNVFQPVGIFEENNGLKLKLKREIPWMNGNSPPAEPKCGFDNEKCVNKPTDWKLISFISVGVIVLLTTAAFAMRHYRYEQKLACLLWKVDMKDVILIKNKLEHNSKTSINVGFESICFSAVPETEEQDSAFRRTPHKLGNYKGNIVFIKPVYKKSIDLTRSLRKEMIQIRGMRQENINPFIGACVDPPNICVMSLYCARGSLHDVLQNPDINLDTIFVASLVADLIKGLTYIHDSEIISHGNLKSSNCLVDSRWVLQITDFSLHEFKAGQELPPSEHIKNLKGHLWTAPELLRAINRPPRGSQKGDVYSFGIILHEIVARKGPWGPRYMAPKAIVETVVNPLLNGGVIFRPETKDLKCPVDVIRCLEECWDEDADQRPDFRVIRTKLREMISEVKTNIFDNMIAIMEKYASNLEGLVQERTHLLMEEKKKTENLLLRMLPKPVAEQLKRGEKVEAESFDCVTIYFSDIVGFTELSAVSTPLQVVDLLNDLYTCFDSIIGNYDVYKVETIGDAYMVVSGLPLRNGDNHAVEIASMAIHLLGTIRNFEIGHRPGARLKLRIGIHSGPCVAGVVGLKMPRYCLFGDTVNTASRMESTGEALKIHVSSTCNEILETFNDFELQERGLTQVKGKGEMRTYWLIGAKSKPEQNVEIEDTSLSSGGSKFRRFTDSTLPRNCSNCDDPFDMDLATSLKSDYKQLLIAEKQAVGAKATFDNLMTYSSCRNILQECKKNLSDLSRNGWTVEANYRSAPSIVHKPFSADDPIG